MKMSSSFFLKNAPKENKKRKLPDKSKGKIINKTKFAKGKKKLLKPAPAKKRPQKEYEEIASDDDVASDIEEERSAPNLVFSSDEGETETPQDKRLRLAKDYLEKIQQQEAERAEERELHDHVAQRLQSEYLDSVGRLRRHIADSIVGYDEKEITLKHKLQQLPLCTIALTSDGKYLFTGAKTQHVLKWNLDTLRIEGSFNVEAYTTEATAAKKENIKKRRSHVVCMCLSNDNKYLALAEGGNSIQIWCPQELKHLKTFNGHRDVVTALVFRRDSHELYSGSKDRSLKIWSLDEMAYVDSLFGHQASITGIDSLSRERAITSGGSDATVRIWKITEESQLIYNGPEGSLEHVMFLNEESFISGSDNGALCLWSAMKKKPLFVQHQIHGLQSNKTANWITALTCLINTDLIATGSCDGFVRLWRTIDNNRKLQPLLQIPVCGFINALEFNADGSKLYAAIGQEHKLGRWWRLPEAKNRVVIITLTVNKSEEDKRQVKSNS